MVKSFLELRIGDKVTYIGDSYPELEKGEHYYVVDNSVNPELGVYLNNKPGPITPYIVFFTLEEEVVLSNA